MRAAALIILAALVASCSSCSSDVQRPKCATNDPTINPATCQHWCTELPDGDSPYSVDADCIHPVSDH